MKIPPHILEAPPTYLDPNMVQAFQRVGFGCLPTWTDQGCALFVHIDTQTIKVCRYAVYSVRLELHEVDECPLLRLDVKVYNRSRDPLRMDCFLNICDKHAAYAAEALPEQEWMVFHWYDERLQYIRSSGIHWSEENRKEAAMMITAAREIVARTGGGNFDRAKNKFIAENPI